MKKYFLLFTLLWSIGMLAQETPVGAVAEEVVPTTPEEAAEKTGELDPLYLDALIELNHSMSENLDKAFVHRLGINKSSLLGGTSLYLGKEWIPVLGWRVGLGYNANAGRATFYNKDSEIYHFHDVELFGDLTLDLMDLFAPQRQKRMFGLKALVGAGGLVNFGFTEDMLSYTDEYSTNPRLNWGIRAGLATRFRISERFALGADLLVYGLDDHFSGVAANFPMDMRINLGLKATWLFPKDEPLPTLPPEPLNLDVDLAADPVKLLPLVNTRVVFKSPANMGKKHRTLEGQTFLDFPVNRTEIYPNYRSNPEKLQEIKATIDVVKYDPAVTIDTIWIHGYASPESPYKNNTRLASGRAESLKQYLIQAYRFKPNMIRVSYTPEDWDGLRRFIRDYYPDDITEKVFAIMDNPKLSPDKREDTYRKFIGEKEYKYLLNTIYPALRHSDYKVAYTIRDYTLEEAKELITKNPNALSSLEMYQVAMSYPQGSEKQIEALTIAAEWYPDWAEVNLNLANALILTGQLDQAETYLQRAGDMPEAIHARGLIEALRHNYEAAEQLLKQSYDMGIDVSASIITPLP